MIQLAETFSLILEWWQLGFAQSWFPSGVSVRLFTKDRGWTVVILQRWRFWPQMPARPGFIDFSETLFFLLHFTHISFALLHSVISYSADCCTFTALQYSLLYFTALFSQLFSASLFRPLMFLEFIQLWSVFSDAVSKWQKDTLVLCVSNVLTTCSVEWSVGVYHNVIRLWWKHFSCSRNTERF